MNPALAERVKANWNILASRQPRVCGCVWINPRGKVPYRSVTCRAHAPVIRTRDALEELP